MIAQACSEPQVPTSIALRLNTFYFCSLHSMGQFDLRENLSGIGLCHTHKEPLKGDAGMGHRNIAYVGWSDECNHLRGFIDHAETHVIDEYTQDELEVLVQQREAVGKDASEYRALLEKMHQWKVMLH